MANSQDRNAFRESLRVNNEGNKIENAANQNHANNQNQGNPSEGAQRERGRGHER